MLSGNDIKLMSMRHEAAVILKQSLQVVVNKQSSRTIDYLMKVRERNLIDGFIWRRLNG